MLISARVASLYQGRVNLRIQDARHSELISLPAWAFAQLPQEGDVFNLSLVREGDGQRIMAAKRGRLALLRDAVHDVLFPRDWMRRP